MNEEECDELVCRLVAAITAKLEDSGAEALEGQRSGQGGSEQIARAELIEIATRDIGLLAEAAAAILREAELPKLTR